MENKIVNPKLKLLENRGDYCKYPDISCKHCYHFTIPDYYRYLTYGEHSCILKEKKECEHNKNGKCSFYPLSNGTPSTCMHSKLNPCKHVNN